MVSAVDKNNVESGRMRMKGLDCVRVRTDLTENMTF